MNATRRDKENPATNSNSISLYIPWNKHITYPLKLTNGVFKMNFPIFRGDSVYFSGEVIKWSKGVEFLTKFRSTPGYVRMEPRKENPMGSRWFVRFMMVCWIVLPVFFCDLYEVYDWYHNWWCWRERDHNISQLVTVRDVKAAAFKSEPQLVGKYLRSPRGWRWHIYRRQNDHGGFGEIIANVDAEDQRRKGWSDVGWLNLDGSMGGSSWTTWKPERRICHCRWVVSIFLPRTHWGTCLTYTLQVDGFLPPPCHQESQKPETVSPNQILMFLLKWFLQKCQWDHDRSNVNVWFAAHLLLGRAGGPGVGV